MEVDLIRGGDRRDEMRGHGSRLIRGGDMGDEMMGHGSRLDKGR